MDHGTAKDDDFDDKHFGIKSKKDGYYDDNKGADDRFTARFLMADEDGCEKGLTCNEERVCIKPRGECVLKNIWDVL